MMGFVVHTLVSALLLYVVGQMVSGIEVRDGKAAIFGALVLGIANAVVLPILVTITLPISILTIGLFVLVLNGVMLMLAAAFVDGFEVEGLRAAIWGSVVLGVMNWLVGMFFG